MTPLNALQAWYTTNCNGHWEHTQGITISTLDNPCRVPRFDREAANRAHPNLLPLPFAPLATFA